MSCLRLASRIFSPRQAAAAVAARGLIHDATWTVAAASSVRFQKADSSSAPFHSQKLFSYPRSKAQLLVTTRRSLTRKPTVSEIKERIMKVCQDFDKISAEKLTADSHFLKDLGLDSLDHVEVIMAVEDEFGFEIPDEHAEKLMTPAKIAQYVVEHEGILE